MQDLSKAEKLKNALREISQEDAEYPKEWQKLPDKPQKLYALGDISLLQGKKFAVVGSRTTPQNALKLGEKIAEELSASITLVTGTADGGDSAAIEGALRGSGKVVCLLAGGFSAMPQSNLPLLRKVAKQGLLLSPHPFETPVRNFSYSYRNKLLAALCKGVLVLGAGEKSGALLTANYALEENKPVFAIPYPPNAANGTGCNGLIKRGAYLTETAQDIAERLGLSLSPKTNTLPLSETEKIVYAALRESAESHINELAQATGVSPFKLRAVLSSLEVKGLCVAVGGNRYALV